VQPKKKGFVKPIRAVSLVGSFGLMMGAAVLIGYYLGSYIDRKLGTSPWGMLAFLILFIVGAFVKFIQSTKELSDDKEKQKGPNASKGVGDG
jgi:F0F1-type ATP synthase assembly protein I